MDPAAATPQPPPLRSVAFQFHKGWGVVALGFAMYFIGAGPLIYPYGVYAIEFKHDFHASQAMISLCYSTILVVGGLTSGPIGWLMDRYPLRILVCVGIAINSASYVVLSQVRDMIQVILVMGVFVSASESFMGSVAVTKIISLWFERRRGFALGVSVIGASIAAIVFPALAAYLVRHVGWRTSFLVDAALVLGLVPAALILAKVPVDGMPMSERITDSAKRDTIPMLSMPQILAKRDFWVIVLSFGLANGAQSALMVTTASFALQKGLTYQSSTLLLSIIGVGALIGKIAFGLMLDRAPLSLAFRMGILLLTGAVAVPLLSFGFPGMAASALMQGFSLGASIPVWGALVMGVFGVANSGRALGATRAAMTPVAFLIPLLSGVLVDRTGSYALGWSALLGVLAVAMGLTFCGLRGR